MELIHPGRARQHQRPGAHVPARDGHGAAAHARRRGGDRQAHRAGQALGHQVDLADARHHQGRHPDGRSAQGRRTHRARTGDLQRRRDHRRPHRTARPAVPEADRQRAQGAPERREAAGKARHHPEEGQEEVPQGGVEAHARPDRRLEADPEDRVHRSGEAPDDRGSEGRRRDRAEGAARARPGQQDAEPEESSPRRPRS